MEASQLSFDSVDWGLVRDAFARMPSTSADFNAAVNRYFRYKYNLAPGLDAVFRDYPETRDTFFRHTLPFVVDCALALPLMLPRVKILDGPGELNITRETALCLLANMFLCTLGPKRDDSMPDNNFAALHRDGVNKQEFAKLRMFIHYFERAQSEPPRGMITIRRLKSGRDGHSWGDSAQPLLPMQVLPKGEGFEGAHGIGCLQADFANMYIGGGVISGGCVMEEIRFSICPELCTAMLVCPCMAPDEAIQVIGGEQFSSAKGYAFQLRYGGDHRDPAPRAADGTVLTAIAAIDALDGRYMGSFSVNEQLQEQPVLRELNKACAGFQAGDAESARQWPTVATGNWGCGAFLGNVEVKAVIQWLAASEDGRRIKYFPFSEDFGPRLQAFTDRVAARGVTVGALFKALVGAGRRGFNLGMGLLEVLEGWIDAPGADAAVPAQFGGGALEEDHGGQVDPKRDCPHMDQFVSGNMPDERAQEVFLAGCHSCRDNTENWICSSCWTVGCARYIAGHMLEHSGSTGHMVATSLMDLNTWCYECDSYIIGQPVSSLRRALYVGKFGRPPPRGEQ